MVCYDLQTKIQVALTLGSVIVQNILAWDTNRSQMSVILSIYIEYNESQPKYLDTTLAAQSQPPTPVMSIR